MNYVVYYDTILIINVCKRVIVKKFIRIYLKFTRVSIRKGISRMCLSWDVVIDDWTYLRGQDDRSGWVKSAHTQSGFSASWVVLILITTRERSGSVHKFTFHVNKIIFCVELIKPAFLAVFSGPKI